ncbi:MAG: DUF3800 domain-containing protein [Desulfocapsaceae bacterium]|nr:DUF3800 domain-containing protein [Desulfocapsaceae bacterium]
MYVYLDETTFGDNDEYSGYACIICKQKIGREFVDSALKALSEDPDIEKEIFKNQDIRTLERKYFHAADDSQNAHSHLCDAINNHVTGKFNSHFFKTKASGFKNSEEAYELASKLSILGVLSESNEVVFVFEERNDLSKEYISNWWESLWDDLLKSQHKYPYIRTYYPVLKFEICTKNEPGLQVVDFILWASSRQVLKKNCPWLSRINSWFRTEIKPGDGSWGGHTLSIGKEPKENELNYEITDYKHDDEKLNSLEYLTHYLVNSQKVINAVANQGKQDGVCHFWEEIEYLEANKITESNTEHIEKMAKCFLKLFDNISLINADTSMEDKSFWLSCRKCFSFALHAHNVMGRMHSIRLSDIRNEIIKNSPEALMQC